LFDLNLLVTPIPFLPQANALIRIVPESVENIWNTLDESIQAQAEKVLKKAQKVSTGCGGTPPREIAAVEMGTSPPPQSISTQVNRSHMVDLSSGLIHWLIADLRRPALQLKVGGDPNSCARSLQDPRTK